MTGRLRRLTGRPGRAGAGRTVRPADPFGALGLPAGPELTDDDVRAAWRRIAAASHPDRTDGGDPGAFAAAAAAYTALRTASSRGEVLADLRAGPPARSARATARPSWPQPGAAAGPLAARQLTARIRRGRPWRLALRLLAAAAASAAAIAVTGSQPATPALITGAITWLVLTARHDLAPPGGGT